MKLIKEIMEDTLERALKLPDVGAGLNQIGDLTLYIDSGDFYGDEIVEETYFTFSIGGVEIGHHKSSINIDIDWDKIESGRPLLNTRQYMRKVNAEIEKEEGKVPETVVVDGHTYKLVDEE